MNAPSTYQRGLFWMAGSTALASLMLIGIGALVTSHEAGMSVPDWPTTKGYNLFLFPVSQWTGGVFYEHTHRLFASWVGFMTLVLALWLWIREPRAWMRWLGGIAVILVVAQGVLGGLRVTQQRSELGIFHATLAHLFVVLASALALFTSRWWASLGARPNRPSCPRRLLRNYGILTSVVLAQLVVAATMRHQHAGLAIPDFPLAYGQWWPDLSAPAIAHYNQLRHPTIPLNPITAYLIVLHLIHRTIAMAILFGVTWLAWRTQQILGTAHPLAKLTTTWLGLVLFQVVLGVATVWSNQAPLMATLHVVVGAMTLVTAGIIVIVAIRLAGFDTTPIQTSAAAERSRAGLIPEVSESL